MENITKAIWDFMTLENIIKFIIIYFFIIWVAIIVWVIKDIRIRTNSIFFQIISVLIVLIWTPFLVFIYLLIRPGKTIYERYYDEIEDNLDIMSEIIEERKQKLTEEKNRKSYTKTKKSNSVKQMENKKKTNIKKVEF